MKKTTFSLWVGMLSIFFPATQAAPTSNVAPRPASIKTTTYTPTSVANRPVLGKTAPPSNTLPARSHQKPPHATPRPIYDNNNDTPGLWHTEQPGCIADCGSDDQVAEDQQAAELVYGPWSVELPAQENNLSEATSSRTIQLLQDGIVMDSCVEQGPTTLNEQGTPLRNAPRFTFPNEQCDDLLRMHTENN